MTCWKYTQTGSCPFAELNCHMIGSGDLIDDAAKVHRVIRDLLFVEGMGMSFESAIRYMKNKWLWHSWDYYQYVNYQRYIESFW